MNIPKFRAWHIESKIMVDVAILIFHPVLEIHCGENKHGEEILFSFDEVILMQSTGLTDKNEREMFLDDVLKFDNGELFQVIHLDKTARFALQGLQTGKLRWFRADSIYAYNEFEVLPHWFEIIGNIHERNLINV